MTLAEATAAAALMLAPYGLPAPEIAFAPAVNQEGAVSCRVRIVNGARKLAGCSITFTPRTLRRKGEALIAHEVAHYIQAAQGDFAMPHDRNWRSIMRTLGHRPDRPAPGNVIERVGSRRGDRAQRARLRGRGR